jgi:YegS/Rv2252/BmrU family lipid kinase
MALGRALLIVNPAARHGETAKLLPRIERLAAPDVAGVETVLSAGPRHALDLAKAAVGFDAVIAVGGDGTAHEVLNGLMEQPTETRPLYGIVPTGSGNDYAHTLGMSDDPATAMLQLASATPRDVDLGRCNGIWFGESVAVGLDARVTAKAVELKTTTKLSGLPLYLRALFYVLDKEYYGHKAVVQYDDNPPFETEMLILAATNGPTYGGGFKITPDSVFDDGLLDICRIDTMPKPEAFMRLPFVIAGKHTKMRPVHMSRARRVTVVAEKPVEGQIDGEVMLERSYDIEVVPKALRVLVPDGPRSGGRS